MPNVPSKYQGFHFQIGPGNADLNYNLSPVDVWDADMSSGSPVYRVMTANSYFCKSGALGGYATKSAASISGSFGIGLPWNMVTPIYEYMISHNNSFDYASWSGKEAFHFWWGNMSGQNGQQTWPNTPTKLDQNVELEEFELIRYAKNPYVLVGVTVSRMNGEYAESFDETGLKLIAKKSLEYGHHRRKMIENYDYQNGNAIQYRNDFEQVVIVLKAVREIPVMGTTTDTAKILTTFLKYSEFKNNNTTYSSTNVLNGHSGLVLTKIVDNLGGITQIEYYPANDARTKITSGYFRDRQSCGSVVSSGYGTSASFTVHPVVKYVLKNDEEDLVKNNTPSSDPNHSKWLYDFDPSTYVVKSATILIDDPQFKSGRNYKPEPGFKTVTVYGPTLTTSNNAYINKTVYNHWGVTYQYNATNMNLDDYLYHGKLKYVAEYDVSGKIFTEKFINYENTLAYQNGMLRPNCYKDHLMWEQEYDGPGNEYEYRDYYLDLPLTVTINNQTLTGIQATLALDVPAFDGRTDDNEMPSFLEFYKFGTLSSNPNNPECLFNSYFIKKTSEIDRKYDDYRSKSATITTPANPGSPAINADPFGTGHLNPAVYDPGVVAAQFNLLKTGNDASIYPALIAQSPLHDSILIAVISNNRISRQHRELILLGQNGLSNPVLNTLLGQVNMLPDQIIREVIQQQPYLSDEVLLTAISRSTIKWSSSLINDIFLKNEYLSDNVLRQFLTALDAGKINSVSAEKILAAQPPFNDATLTILLRNRQISSSSLPAILKDQVVTNPQYQSILTNKLITNSTIIEIIKNVANYPDPIAFDLVLNHYPAFSIDEMEQIVNLANRELTTTELSTLQARYGNLPWIINYNFRGNPLDAYCSRAEALTWSYIENKTAYEYYEANYSGYSNGPAYKTLLALEDIPNKVAHRELIYSELQPLTLTNLRLKHEPSWQVFSISKTSPHLPGAEQKNQYFYLYDLKNRYDRYWYYYDLGEPGQESRFSPEVLNNGLDTVMIFSEWDTHYQTSSNGLSIQNPPYDGQVKSRQFGMKTTTFQETNLYKKPGEQKYSRKSQYYFYDARWKIDINGAPVTVHYEGPSCPETGGNPEPPSGCESCVYYKTTNENQLWSEVPLGYCLWKVPQSIFYMVCPQSVNYSACSDAYEKVACKTNQAEENDNPAKNIPPAQALSEVLQLRQTVVQLDTLLAALNQTFMNKRFDRNNRHVVDFTMTFGTQDQYGILHPYSMVYPYDTLTTLRIHARNEHLQPALISNAAGLKTRFYYKAFQNHWNVNDNCTNPGYSWNYNYSSTLATDIGLPVRATVGYGRVDSLATTFEFTDDGQVKTMIAPSGHRMDYEFDGYQRLVKVIENQTRLLSRNSYNYWQHDFTKSFGDRTEQNFVLSTVYQRGTDTVYSREFQKAYVDPLNRNTGAVKAYYLPNSTVNISSGMLTFDNWGRPVSTLKTFRTVDVAEQGPVRYVANSTANALHSDVIYDNDPASLDVRHSDPGEDINGLHTVRKETCIVSNVIASCELGLNGPELRMIMKQGNTDAFRFLKITVTDQDDKKTVSYHNAFGQLVGTIDGNKAVTLYIYDAFGNLTKTINDKRQHTNYSFNLLGQLTIENNVDGGEKRYIYNRHGKVAAVQDEQDRKNTDAGISAPRFRTFTYDIYGNVIQQKLVTVSYHADPFKFSTTHIGQNNTPVLDADGNPHYFHYIWSYRMTQDWLNNYTTWGGNPAHPITIQNLSASLNMTTISVREKEFIYGISQASSSTLGKLVQSKSYGLNDKVIQSTSFTYNSEDLVEQQVNAMHPEDIASTDGRLLLYSIRYAYNYRGNLLTEQLDVNNDGIEDINYFYNYDALNRLTVVSALQGAGNSGSATKLAEYTYDDERGTVATKNYHVAGLTNPIESVTYVYDARDRLINISSGLMQYQMYYDGFIVPGYNDAGPDVLTQSYNYNGNINGIRVNYSFGNSANSSSVAFFSKPTTYGYRYDQGNRLTLADASVGNFIDAQFANAANTTPGESYKIGDERYQYDKIGNLRSLLRTLPDNDPSLGSLVDDFSYNYQNGTNKLTQVDNLTSTSDRNYTYDRNGNLLTDDYREIDATVYGRTAYAYHIDKADGEQIDHLYDNADLRIMKKTVSSGTTTLEYHIKDAMGRDLAIKKVVTQDDSQQTTLEYYVYGADRIAQIVDKGVLGTAISGAEATFFLTDHLGNNRVAFNVDGSGNAIIMNAMDYYPYGKILREFDNGDGDRFLTTQHERDRETGLDYRGARYYDSDVARFLSLDPLAAKYPAWSAYNYVMGNPLLFIDPDGKEASPTRWTENHTTLNQIFGDPYQLNELIRADPPVKKGGISSLLPAGPLTNMQVTSNPNTKKGGIGTQTMNKAVRQIKKANSHKSVLPVAIATVIRGFPVDAWGYQIEAGFAFVGGISLYSGYIQDYTGRSLYYKGYGANIGAGMGTGASLFTVRSLDPKKRFTVDQWLGKGEGWEGGIGFVSAGTAGTYGTDKFRAESIGLGLGSDLGLWWQGTTTTPW